MTLIPNKANIDRLIAVIKNDPIKFNMSNWDWTSSMVADRIEEVEQGAFSNVKKDDLPPLCGSPACIMGWANHLKAVDEGLDPTDVILDSSSDANNFIFLPDEYGYVSGRSHNLYHPPYNEGDPAFSVNAHPWDRIKPEQAIRTLEHLRDTGEISWNV